MLQYIIEVIIWTVILYSILEITKKLIYKFVISQENLKRLKKLEYIKFEKCKTKSENQKI